MSSRLKKGFIASQTAAKVPITGLAFVSSLLLYGAVRGAAAVSKPAALDPAETSK
jgi:hypothetical protein